jgi:RES domain-containing protein
VLAVPSAIIPAEFNNLLNPHHPSFSRIIVGPAEAFTTDQRLHRT